MLRWKSHKNCWTQHFNNKKTIWKKVLVQEQRQLQGRPPICEPGRQTQVISWISQWYPQSLSDILSIWSQYLSDPSIYEWSLLNLSFFVKPNSEFRRSAPNQPSPWSNPIRQLDLTNWQTEHSATSFENFFQVFRCKIEILYKKMKLKKKNNVGLFFQGVSLLKTYKYIKNNIQTC